MKEKGEKKTDPSVAIILLNWNNFNDTRACLRSLENLSYANFHCIVVENGSEDGSGEKLASIKNITLIPNQKNLGFSGGNNVAIKFALKQKFDYVLLLNNDTVVDSKFLSFLVDEAERDISIGVAGPKIYYWGSQKKIWGAGGGISRLLKRTFHFGENRFDNGEFDQIREVDFVSGCCMLIRREVVEKIGLLDPVYFMYYEDVDFCQRAQRAGFKIVYVPESIIWHKVSATSNRAFRDYYRMRNHIIFLKKNFNYSTLRIVFMALIVSKERALRILARKFVRGDRESVLKRMKSLVVGFFDGIKFNPEKK